MNRDPIPADNDIVTNIAIFVFVSLILLFAILLLNVVYRETARYRRTSTAYWLNPKAYESSPERWQEIIEQEKNWRQKVDQTARKMNIDLQSQEELLRIQREQEKVQRAFR